ncbi:MAG TPA: aminotransferase class V-fold PLP-dependent enzyme [Gemmatimonadales bacterium]|nr:aminotransferase class V-fold PLP-dependent enzyme [Gemmatimonadales bacterium]
MEEFAGLRHLFQTQEPVSIVPAPAALLREIGLRATIDHRVLVPVTGEESAALADTAESLGAEVVRLMVHPGDSVEPELLERWLREPAIDSLALVHSEPSTGVLAPLEAIAGVMQRHPDLVLFVDAVDSLGATPIRTDLWGLDFVLAASDGPLGLPPGLAFATASPRLLARTHGLQGRGVMLDYRTHHTAAAEGTLVAELPPMLGPHLVRRLRELEGDGLEALWNRYAHAAAMLAEWVNGRKDLSLVAREGRRSPTVSCFRLEDSRPATGVADRLGALGWTVGITLMEGWVGLQVEHVGEAAIERMPALLTAMEEALRPG